MDFIDREAAIEAIKDPVVKGFAMYGPKSVPSVPAVPLDKLCEFLADIYGSPCQLGEIEPYPGCEPDDEGNCYGMRTSNVACWKDFIQYNIGTSYD